MSGYARKNTAARLAARTLWLPDQPLLRTCLDKSMSDISVLEQRQRVAKVRLLLACFSRNPST